MPAMLHRMIAVAISNLVSMALIAAEIDMKSSAKRFFPIGNPYKEAKPSIK